jgi:hypothetical protein
MWTCLRLSDVHQDLSQCTISYTMYPPRLLLLLVSFMQARDSAVLQVAVISAGPVICVLQPRLCPRHVDRI